MKQMSLMSLCKDYGLSRRAIQGYEKIGLIRPDSKTSRGYLIYKEKTIRRILLIRYFQNIGYHLKEIKDFIDKPNEVLKEKIRSKIKKLEEDLDNTEKLINDSLAIIRLLDEKDSDEKIFAITGKENI